MKTFLRKLRRREEGASLVEYALLVALIAVACILTLQALGLGINGAFTAITAAINAAIPG